MKNQKGITLIALVITIIVLLILAGVSIAMLTGDNGILTQASRSKRETLDAEIVERVNLELNAQMANAMAGDAFDEASKITSNIGLGEDSEYAVSVAVNQASESSKGDVTISIFASLGISFCLIPLA